MLANNCWPLLSNCRQNVGGWLPMRWNERAMLRQSRNSSDDSVKSNRPQAIASPISPYPRLPMRSTSCPGVNIPTAVFASGGDQSILMMDLEHQGVSRSLREQITTSVCPMLTQAPTTDVRKSGRQYGTKLLALGSSLTVTKLFCFMD